MHFVCFRPPPPPQKKNCRTIVLDFSWDHCNTQEKLETMVMQNFFLRGGGAVNKLYYGLCEGHEWAEFTSLPPGERIPYNGLQGRLGQRGIPFLGLRYIDSRAVKG